MPNNANLIRCSGQVKPAHVKAAALTDVNWVCISGILFTYEGSDDEVLATGLIDVDGLPGSKKGCNRRTGQFLTSRLGNGNVRLRVPADYATKHTPNFMRFLGALLCDSRLSLVRGEVMP